MKIILIALICLFGSLAQAGKGTNDLLLDVNVAVRGLQLNEDQKALLEAAVKKTKELPDITSGTKSSFKSALSTVIDNDKATFIDLVDSPVAHYRGKLHETVMGHHDIAVKWAKFDDALDAAQRSTFRARMAETISKTFQSMTSGSVRLASIEDLSVGEFARKLDLTPGQKAVLAEKFKSTLPKIKALDDRSAQATRKVSQTLTDSGAQFMNIPDAMLDYYNGLIAALEAKSEYGASVFNELNVEQKKILTEMVRSRLKILRLVL